MSNVKLSQTMEKKTENVNQVLNIQNSNAYPQRKIRLSILKSYKKKNLTQKKKKKKKMNNQVQELRILVEQKEPQFEKANQLLAKLKVI